MRLSASLPTFPPPWTQFPGESVQTWGLDIAGRFREEFAPQIGFGQQQARRQVLLDLLPSCQRLRRSQALLKHSQTQRVSEFDAMEAGEIEEPRIISLGSSSVRSGTRLHSAGGTRHAAPDGAWPFPSTFTIDMALLPELSSACWSESVFGGEYSD